MFSSRPIVASSTTRLVPPEEMNGSGTPVSGAMPSTAQTFSSAWQRISAVRPGGEQLLVARRRGLRGAQARVADHPVEQQQAADPGDAELLADDGEDEVRVRLGQVEDLLHRLAEADAEQAAGAERDLALDGLKAGVARVAPTG